MNEALKTLQQTQQVQNIINEQSNDEQNNDEQEQ